MGGTVCKRLLSSPITLLRYIFAPPLTYESVMVSFQHKTPMAGLETRWPSSLG